MVVERFLDAIWLVVGIGIAAILVPLPKNLMEAGDVLGVVVLVGGALFLWIVLRKEKQLEHAESNTPAKGVRGFIGTLATGLREIGISRHFYLSALLSAGMLFCQALAVWFMMLACGIRLPIQAGIVVVMIVRLGTAIPNAPANVGSFQFFTVVALGLFAVDKTTAAAFSIVDFVALTAPLWIIGLVAINRTGMSLATIKLRVADLRRNSAQP